MSIATMTALAGEFRLRIGLRRISGRLPQVSHGSR
jgi:hypothetical protein